MWQIILSGAIFLTAAYCVLILFYLKCFNQLKHFKPTETVKPLNRFSIIIPARNEEANIEKCIRSIVQNNYPADLFEIIVVDDFSSDKTSLVVQNLQQQFLNLRLIQLKNIAGSIINSYKKKAIETGIYQSSFEWIVTTDADCVIPCRLIKSRLWKIESKEFLLINLTGATTKTESLF